MRATVYYDPLDVAIDPLIAAQHFDNELRRMRIDAEVVMKADARVTGRRPLLVIDGGALGASALS